MHGHFSDATHVAARIPLSYDDWLAVLDAREPNATSEQRDIAQDTIQRPAPRGWLDAVEDRDSH